VVAEVDMEAVDTAVVLEAVMLEDTVTMAMVGVVFL
jgi:hypothetical protein